MFYLSATFTESKYSIRDYSTGRPAACVVQCSEFKSPQVASSGFKTCNNHTDNARLYDDAYDMGL